MWSTVFPYKWAYPGDKYVKWVGITVLNFGADRKWRNPGPLIDKRVRASKKFTKRPIIISELATAYEGGNKASWLKSAYVGSYKKHPKIKAIMYLDTDEPACHGTPAGLAPGQAGRRLRAGDVPVDRVTGQVQGHSSSRPPVLRAQAGRLPPRAQGSLQPRT